MKKLFIFVTTLSFLGISSLLSPVLSQETSATPSSMTSQNTNFDKAYEDYVAEIKDYQKAREEYLLRRSQFLRFQSLKSRQDAQEATVSFLEKRDNVVTSYLAVLQARIFEAIGVSDVRKEALNLRLSEEIGWFKDHRDTIPSAGTLDDLVKDSDEAKKRWESIGPLIYEALSTVSYGRIIDFANRTELLLGDAKSKLEEIKSDEREEYKFSNEKFEVLDRWIFETESRIVRSKEKMLDVENLISLMIKQKKDLVRAHNEIIQVLGESQLFLKEANSFMKEIIREVKTAEE